MTTTWEQQAGQEVSEISVRDIFNGGFFTIPKITATLFERGFRIEQKSGSTSILFDDVYAYSYSSTQMSMNGFADGLLCVLRIARCQKELRAPLKFVLNVPSGRKWFSQGANPTGERTLDEISNRLFNATFGKLQRRLRNGGNVEWSCVARDAKAGDYLDVEITPEGIMFLDDPPQILPINQIARIELERIETQTADGVNVTTAFTVYTQSGSQIDVQHDGMNALAGRELLKEFHGV